MQKHLSSIVLFFLLSASCQKNACSDSVKATFVDATGTDGCGMIIELTNGKFLEPKNLNDFDVVPKNGKKYGLVIIWPKPEALCV